MKNTKQSTMFDPVIREFKTLNAALKYQSRIIEKTFIQKNTSSKYDIFWPENKPVYAVTLFEISSEN